MKFRVQMKNPDALYNAIADAVNNDVTCSEASLRDDAERMAVKEIRTGKISKLCSRWFRYGEYLTVEIDTVAETCVVLPAIV